MLFEPHPDAPGDRRQPDSRSQPRGVSHTYTPSCVTLATGRPDSTNELLAGCGRASATQTSRTPHPSRGLPRQVNNLAVRSLIARVRRKRRRWSTSPPPGLRSPRSPSNDQGRAVVAARSTAVGGDSSRRARATNTAWGRRSKEPDEPNLAACKPPPLGGSRQAQRPSASTTLDILVGRAE